MMRIPMSHKEILRYAQKDSVVLSLPISFNSVIYT